MMSSFFSSSFDALTLTTATDDAEAPVNDGLEEEAADEIAGADGLFGALATRAEGVVPPPHHHHQSSSMSLNKLS